jgi:hypothetical protein
MVQTPGTQTYLFTIVKNVLSVKSFVIQTPGVVTH